MGEKKVADLSYLRKMSMNDEGIVIQTVEAFLEETPKSLEYLQFYHKNRNWEKLAQTAHKLKPNLKYMGMEAAYELILSIEDQAKSKQTSASLDDNIQHLGNICNKAHQELSAKVERWKT